MRVRQRITYDQINAIEPAVTTKKRRQRRVVFFDEHALLISDPDHSGAEERFVFLGLSSALRALVVCHCYRHGTVVRIISARKANRSEREQYEPINLYLRECASSRKRLTVTWRPAPGQGAA